MTKRAKPERFPFVEPKHLERAVVVCHRNADADSYLSAVAVSYLLKRLVPGTRVDIATPGGMTTLTTKLSKRFPHRMAGVGDKDYDLYVAVDVGDRELLQEWGEEIEGSSGVSVLIDHHPLRDRSTYDHFVVDEGATSAAEVVFGLYSELKVRPDRKTAQALLEAILFDSSHLAIASPGAVRAVVKLMDAGADLRLARRELRSEPDFGEVMAKLKGAQRLKVFRLGEWVVGTSIVGSFQAHVARALLYLGADVGVVGGESEGETRVSLRATQRFAERSGVQLGTQVAEAVAKAQGGHGGGHATAASFSSNAGEDEAVEAVTKKLGELLKQESKPLD